MILEKNNNALKSSLVLIENELQNFMNPNYLDFDQNWESIPYFD